MRIVIVEDEALLRRGLELVLGEGGHETVASAESVANLSALIEEYAPDLVITDIRMPPTYTTEGLRAACALRRERPGLPVLVLSQHVQRGYARDLLATGSEGVGYLLKQRISDIPSFLADLDRIAAGGTALDPEVVAVMVDRARRDGDAITTLTPRQQEVLALVAEGRSNASIAAALFVAEKSIVQHVSRIYDALGLAADQETHRRVQAVVHFLNRE